MVDEEEDDEVQATEEARDNEVRRFGMTKGGGVCGLNCGGVEVAEI